MSNLNPFNLQNLFNKYIQDKFFTLKCNSLTPFCNDWKLKKSQGNTAHYGAYCAATSVEEKEEKSSLLVMLYFRCGKFWPHFREVLPKDFLLQVIY